MPTTEHNAPAGAAAAVPSTLPPAAPSAELLAALLQSRGDLLLIKDVQAQRYVHANDAMLQFLGRSAAELAGRTDGELFDAALTAAMRASEQTALAQGSALTTEQRFEWAGARREFSVLRVMLAPQGAAGPGWLCSVWTDLAPQRQRDAQLKQALEQIEQQQQANDLLRRQLSDQALRDPESGLHRGAHFEDQLRREVDLSTREHREFAVVYIAIDPPTAQEQSLGAAGHRAVLEALGRLLRSSTRAMDASCRHGERRFAVLLSGVGLATAHSRMEGLRRKCASLIVVHEGQELGYTVAMGVASFPHTAHTQEALSRACENALAEAQRRGGNQVTLAAIAFEPGGSSG